MNSLFDLLERWAEREPERIKKHGQDLAGVTRFSLVFQGHEFPLAYTSLEALPAHRGALLAAEDMAVASHGWGWTKDYALRNDATVLRQYEEGGNITMSYPFRCTGHGTEDCPKELEVNLLDAYLKALDGDPQRPRWVVE